MTSRGACRRRMGFGDFTIAREMQNSQATKGGERDPFG